MKFPRPGIDIHFFCNWIHFLLDISFGALFPLSHIADFFSLVKEKAEGLGQTAGAGERLGFRLDSSSSGGSRARRDSAESSTSRDSYDK